MDSKLKNGVIAISIILILAVLTVVGLTNYKKIVRMFGVKANTETVAEEVLPEAAPAKEASNKLGNDLSAWKRDETFFDSEADTLAAKLLEDMITLTAKATSIEGDIRITVYDYEGNLKTGERVQALIYKGTKQVKTVTDTDKDGIIYVPNMSEGDYSISIAPLEGYIVPEKLLEVSVKDEIEYVKIDDIVLFYTNEADAATTADDIAVNTAEATADKKQKTSFGNDKDVCYGIDVSSKNGEIDWKTVYDSGIRFVMLRAGYRGAVSGEMFEDKAFKDNAEGAIRAGLDVGAYFFSQATTEREAVEEASALMDIVGGSNITYPLVVRVDQAGGLGRADGLSQEARTGLVEVFSQTVKNMGYTPCVYASAAWLDTNLDSRLMEKYMIWMAEYKGNPSSKDYYYDIWQYSSKGQVPGVEGDVALNISYIK